jgi:hypothetical protein
MVWRKFLPLEAGLAVEACANLSGSEEDLAPSHLFSGDRRYLCFAARVFQFR